MQITSHPQHVTQKNVFVFQVLTEDGRTNRLVESVNLFGVIVGHSILAAASMILFLNKADLMPSHLQKIKFATHFPDYSGLNEYEEVCCAIAGMFCARLPMIPDDTGQNHVRRQLYQHRTCATDSEALGAVVSSVLDMLHRDGIKKLNLY